ncbi:transglutaminase-like domain-containing protein [Alicyclobacillus fastidiosus]|uniref:Transglutaminase-like domain-containing protein n=1 Tax=Alicyclobacillus fastidiosus TaxID=392011 RepID=A0ABV5AF99_9BACL|nr:transglutaminase-like domain-containing protein [Alicyclobacillus fastidiosus]WEH09403.1 transglutaminase-like domain-containing protein [Alicyclobacillus fastidiosus]
MRRFRHVKVLQRGAHALICAVWLYSFFPPIAQLGLLSGPKTFILPFAVLAFSMVFRWWWVRGLGALAAAFAYVAYYWRPTHTTFALSVVHMPGILLHQVLAAFVETSISEPLQTFLFVCGVTIVYWLVSYASARSRLWMFYNVLAIVVLAAIDGNTQVHPNGEIVVVVSLFLVVLGLNQLQRVSFFAVAGSKPGMRFYPSVLALVAIALVVGYATPKEPALWPNPLGKGPEGSGAGIQTIGYQLDNSHLGGSFVASDEQVLSVSSRYPTYLRGQTLSTYTGKGWTSAKLTDAQMSQQTVGHKITGVGTYTYHNLPTVVFNQTITLDSDSVSTRALLGGYRVDDVRKLPGTYQGHFAVDTAQGNIQAPNLQSGQSYEVETEELRDPYTILMKDDTPVSSVKAQVPSDIAQNDLQLPSELPRDVGQLAQHIVGQSGAKTEYAAVMAIVQYLQANYTYQTTGVPVPGAHQDYVEQFLFSSKVGYCNNFSSAAAVMLRTLGVPTRWVTGFAAGSQDFSDAASTNKYIITNDDAHSWVEVYFPAYGWIPFDPTPNFQMPFAAGKEAASTTPASPSAPTPQKAQPPARQPASPPASAGGGGTTTFWSQAQLIHVALWVLCGCLLAAAIALLVWRTKWTLYRLERLWQKEPRRAFARAYGLLWRRLRRRHRIDRAATLRELWPFAFGAGIAQAEYKAWVQAAERVLYGGEPLDGEAATAMRQTTMKWLRLMDQSKRRHKSPIDDIDPTR